jgi:hypothetical protein
MAYCAERDEEFHVSTVFSYYTAYFAQIFCNISNLVSSGIAMALNYSYSPGINAISCNIFFYDTNYPLIIFSDLKAVDAIKFSF